MPKGKQHQQHGGGACKKKERAVRAAYRRERRSGSYLSPGDPDFKSFSNQLAVQGLRLRDVPGDGCVGSGYLSTSVSRLKLSVLVR